MLLSQKADAVDHLLGPGARGIQPARESRVLLLEMLDALRGHNTLHSRRLEALDAGFRLESTAAERGELVAEVLHELLQLGEGGYFRTYAV
jgi:hypothetical protein